MLENIIIKDGSLERASELGIAPLSEAFAYGFGVFTTIKFVNTHLCFFVEHYNRLKQRAEALGMFLNRSHEELLEDAKSLLAVEGVLHGVLKASVVRDQGGSHCMLYLRSREYPEPITEPQTLVISGIQRYSKSLSTLNKTHNYIDNIVALQEARTLGADDAVFTNEKGEVTECTMSNLFLIQGDKLCTPRISCGLLDGVVRSHVLSFADKAGLRLMEGTFFPHDLLRASEVFHTNCVRGIIPVKEFRTNREKALYDTAKTEEIRKLFAHDESRNLY